MTQNPVAYDEFKLTTASTVKVDVLESPLAAERNEPSVYAAHWQARSGFFNLTPKGNTASIDLVPSGLP